jgi:hypothetical protein
MTCSEKRQATPSDLRPGLIIHDASCTVSFLAISTTVVDNESPGFDWKAGVTLHSYPAIIYRRNGEKIDTKAGYYTLLSSLYHVAEVQKLEDPA